MQNCKVSVIIPAYNVAPFIVECLDSVYEQTYSNIELIVVNDGSTDETLAMLRDYRVEHGTMILIDQPNRGLSAARNAGLDIASGDFVFFLDLSMLPWKAGSVLKHLPDSFRLKGR